MKRSSPPTMSSTFLCLICLLLFPLHTAQPITDPDEARVVNSVFSKWGIRAHRGWNISGELCSGVAMNESITIDDVDYNPLIKCDCLNKSTRCRITALKVSALAVRGAIPEEIWTLTSLTYLILAQNVLTGSLSPRIGNLTRMQWLLLSINSLSGPIPREIGRLADLRALGLGTNNFSGSLPAEIGNCLKLQRLYIDSSGLSGEIPRTFANLQELQTVWATDVELIGPVPEFIGNWSKLSSLWIQGTSLEGPIPSSITYLTSLTELIICDLTGGSSTLEFIDEMTSPLETLMLRNNNISGTIPRGIRGLDSLELLDLSFNNISGPILDWLFNSNVVHLFLGNNKLKGSLPDQKGVSLVYIDVSYNQLDRRLPTWVTEGSPQYMNLVANNFNVEDSVGSGSLHGLNCLQRSFPCNQGKGIYYNFAVKCGGPQITSSDGLVYEGDNETLGPSSYFVSETQRWAATNVGYFTGRINPRYTASLFTKFPGTRDSELFQTARISASSLRYYGLGLENGNYTVKIQFAEIEIKETSSLPPGRRIFDIYVQGNRVLKDFDIRRAAGGSSFRVVEREFRARVSEHDFKPTVSNRPPKKTTSNKPSAKENDNTGMIVGIVVGVGVAGFLIAIAIFFLVRRRRHTDGDEELRGIDTKPYTFSYSELKAATDDFDVACKLGEGGFGPVYKGVLHDGREIAVKQLSVASRQGKAQFIAEIATISAVQHRNLVKLYGCCMEGDQRLLVYEYLPNRSLDQALFGQRSLQLDWSTRYMICLGTARGLAYLHEESRLRVVHRDIKASNILLDSDLVPKISDFGLAKLYDDKETHISTRVAGTIGYLAPEYALRGHLTEKVDVFAFGVMTLEIVSGRPNCDPSLDEDKKYLLEWAWNLHENDSKADLLDPRISEFSAEEVERAIGVALMCTQTAPTLRPQMSRVVAMLSGDVKVGTVTSRPVYISGWEVDDVTSFTGKDTARATNFTTNFSSACLSNTDGIGEFKGATSFNSAGATKASASATSDTSCWFSSPSNTTETQNSPQGARKPILRGSIEDVIHKF